MTAPRRPSMKASILAFMLLAVVACASSSSGTTTGRLPLRRVRDVDLPGRTTRFDYVTVDRVGRRLYIAHLGDSQVVVVDLDRLRPVATIPSAPAVHGVLAAP